jgi:hypothetical protein
MAWLDNVNWPKVVLLLGALVIVLGVVIFSPEARVWISDIARMIFDSAQNLFGGSE